jgi:small-conductance mechanosensitive channel
MPHVKLTLGLLLAALAIPLRAAEPPAAAPATAAVTIDGNTLFMVRGVTAYPAAERAQAIISRIEQVADDRSIAPDSLKLVVETEYTGIFAGTTMIMGVFDGDAALEGVAQRALLARLYRDRIAAAIVSYRLDREPRVMVRRALYAAGAIGALLAALFALAWLFGRLDALLEQRYKLRFQDVDLKSFHVLRAEQLWAAVRGLLGAVKVLAMLVGAYLALNFALGLFPATRGIAHHLLGMLLEPLAVMGHGLVNFLPDLFFLAILAVVTRYALRIMRPFFAAVARGRVTLEGFDADWAWPTYKILRLLVIAFAVVVAYPYIPGSETAAFKGVTLFLGVIFSFGSTSILSNVVAGIAIPYRRVFRVGDRIRVGDTVGDVTDMRVQVTCLRSPKNEQIVLPNSLILNSQVLNYSALARSDGLILHTAVGIGYETPWRQVEAMLLLAAARSEGLKREPAPFVLQQALGDFCVTYELNAYCDNASAMPELYSALHRNILDVFNEHGVQIMTPAYVADPPEAKLVPKAKWFAAPAERPAKPG